MQDKIKLNLGSGDKPLEGYVNLDRKTGDEVYPLVGYEDDSVDEIRASHVLEHFGRVEVFKVLQNWVSKLKIDGVLKIAVPDFAIIAEQYVKGNRDKSFDYAGFLLGSQTDDNDYHKAIFDRQGLTTAFESLGLKDIKAWESTIKDCASLAVSLNLEGTKTFIKQHKPDEWRMSVLKESLRPAVEGIIKKAKNVYSQFGEDGVVDEIFKRIGTENKWCLEVGASDGVLFSNTRRLVERGWNAVLIESDGEKYKRLVGNCEQYPKVNCLHQKITATEGNDEGSFTLDRVLSKFDVPADIDLVCIDIDGQDWHIWNQMLDYRPRVVMIEYNPELETSHFIPAIGKEGQAGMVDIMDLAVSKGYRTALISPVNAICIRNEDAELLFEGKKKEEVKETNIVAVMSMPRLAFTDNIFSGMAAFVPLGITYERAHGVFWGQVLTRLIEKHLDSDMDYIITCDYDTYFSKNQVVRLIQLMVENPDADAICALQVKREKDSVLIAKQNEDGTPAKIIKLDKDLIPIDSGHFGLTIFKASCFNKLKKPWFLGVPNADGDWGDGRLDEDVYFWSNFKKCGLKLFLAHQIGIGHLQMMCTFPGKPGESWKPLHKYMNDVHEVGIPKWCEPKVKMLN